MNTGATRTKRRFRGFATVSAAVLAGALLSGAVDWPPRRSGRDWSGQRGLDFPA